MNIQSATLLYFSPTATTQKALDAIAQGMGIPVVQTIDITRTDIRNQAPPAIEGQILLAGAPVYGGRLPRVAQPYFDALKADGVLAVPVVVYGNREFEDALLELKDLLDQAGATSVAAGAFLGEHSFSGGDFQVAPGRPDARDLETARKFGQKVAALLEGAKSPAALGRLTVPGNSPYKQGMPPAPVEFIEVSDDCNECATCVAVCPVEAVDAAKGFAVKNELCIHCCACIKACPEGARIMVEGKFKDIAKWLFENYAARKDPETFFPG